MASEKRLHIVGAQSLEAIDYVGISCYPAQQSLRVFFWPLSTYLSYFQTEKKDDQTCSILKDIRKCVLEKEFYGQRILRDA